MNADQLAVVMWAIGIVLSIIGVLIMLLYKVHSTAIEKKADTDSVTDLERRHDEMGRRIGQMHEDNRFAASAMEARFRQDYALLNQNIVHLTGRVDQVLIQARRVE